MRLRYTQPALADLDAILEYIAIHSPQGAARVHARIEVIINLLLSHLASAYEPKIQQFAKSIRLPIRVWYSTSWPATKSLFTPYAMARAILPACPAQAD